MSERIKSRSSCVGVLGLGVWWVCELAVGKPVLYNKCTILFCVWEYPISNTMFVHISRPIVADDAQGSICD